MLGMLDLVWRIVLPHLNYQYHFWEAVASIGGALLGSSSSDKAAKAAERAAKESAKVQWDMYSQSRTDMEPWRQTGQNALAMYSGMLGVPAYTPQTQTASTAAPSDTAAQTQQTQQPILWGHDGNEQPIYIYPKSTAPATSTPAPTTAPPTATTVQPAPTAPDYSAFYKSPGYTFRLNEGINALDRSAASRGRLYSGAQMKGVNNYAQGMASEEYNNYANRLASLAGVGQTAATSTASLGAQTAGNVGNSLMEGGQARASGYLGQANAWGNALNDYMTWQGMNTYGGYGAKQPTMWGVG